MTINLSYFSLCLAQHKNLKNHKEKTMPHVQIFIDPAASLNTTQVCQIVEDTILENLNKGGLKRKNIRIEIGTAFKYHESLSVRVQVRKKDFAAEELLQIAEKLAAQIKQNCNSQKIEIKTLKVNVILIESETSFS